MSAKLKHNLSISALFLIFISFCLTFASLFNLPNEAASAEKDITLNGAALQQLYLMTNSWSFRTESYFPLIVALYAIGISFQLVVLISGYLKLKQLKQTNISEIPVEWLQVAQNTLMKLGITKKVQFYLSEKVNVPLAVGFLKPVVLFPIALVSQLDMKQVEAILIHELSHIRRNDYMLNLIKTGIETLLFFNPFVWLTSRFIHIEREHACDDLVINFTNEPVTYAHALLKLELIKDKSQPALSLAATGKNQHLYQRIKRITDMKTNYMNAKQKILALCLTLATVISLAWINPTKEEATVKKQQKITTVNSMINAKSIDQKVCLKADTDTVKRKIKREIIIKSKDGKRTVYNSIDEMPDSLKLELADIELKINSPEWQEQLKKVELNGRELSKMFETKEWKDKMNKIEFNSKEMEKMFNSKEWKDKIAKIEFHSKELAQKFNTPEWKEKIAKIELNSKELAKQFESPEWKEKMKDIQLKGKELSEKFNSPEWKKKMAELEELQSSPEYKKLREQYEKDLEQLKKKKGLSTEKAFLIYDGVNPMQVASLPAYANQPIKTVFANVSNAISITETFANPKTVKVITDATIAK
ncbi:MAG: peptidase M56 [Flavobacterium sp.]|nr:MAG: peptidase M56 [Flavobacterium sp.]